MKNKSLLMVRVDAGAKVGMGHAMRCLALAQAWKDAGGEVRFVMTQSTSELRSRLRSEGIKVITFQVKAGSPDDALRTSTWARRFRPSWLVLDGYSFGSQFQKRVKEAKSKLLVIDDEGRVSHYYADLILNQNPHARKKMYPQKEPYTRLLLGPTFILLRREFLRFRGKRKQITQSAKKILVTLGGEDSGDAGKRIFQVFSHPEFQDFEILFVSGKKSKEIPRLMSEADLALSASGSTAWELAFMGVPSLLVVRAKNQRSIAVVLARRGAAQNLGACEPLSIQKLKRSLRKLIESPSLRRSLSQRGKRIADGRGAERVVDYLKERDLGLRRPILQDISRLWKWNNHPAVRKASFQSKSIPWEEHQRWFRSRMKDPRCRLYIGETQDEKPVGQARFDLRGRKAVVSIVVDPKQQGRGHGSKLIRLASEALFHETPIQNILAYIKPSNPSSVRAFLKAGYKRRVLTRRHNVPVLLFSLSKQQGEK